MRPPSSLSSYDLGTYFKIMDAAVISCDAFWLLKELILVFRDYQSLRGIFIIGAFV